jgi:[ribosomal protein S5]-alanine N-acetyltransferase
MFESERLVFDRHHPRNLRKLHEWQNDRELLDLTADRVALQTEAQTRAALERWCRAADDIEHLAMHLKPTGELIGFAQLALIDREHRRCKMAIVIGEKRLWRRGLGTEAIRRMARHAFEDIGLNRIGAEIFAFNEGSRRAFEAAGFVREGTLRQNVRRGEDYHDELLYGLLRADWEG